MQGMDARLGSGQSAQLVQQTRQLLKWYESGVVTGEETIFLLQRTYHNGALPLGENGPQNQGAILSGCEPEC